MPAGTTVELEPGEGITLQPGCYHKLTAPRVRVLLGEVSAVNDDVNDNRFHQPIGRFPGLTRTSRPVASSSVTTPPWRAADHRTRPTPARLAPVVRGLRLQFGLRWMSDRTERARLIAT